MLACFCSLQLFSLYWSVAPSIFNIKEQKLAHCLFFNEIGPLDKVYIRDMLSYSMEVSDDGHVYNIFSGNL